MIWGRNGGGGEGGVSEWGKEPRGLKRAVLDWKGVGWVWSRAGWCFGGTAAMVDATIRANHGVSGLALALGWST